LKPYEIALGVYGLKIYAYENSGTDAIVGFQVASTGTRTDVEPHLPSLISPANNATGFGLTPTLEASAFSDPDAGGTHANSRWTVDDTSDLSSPVWDSGDTGAGAAFTVTLNIAPAPLAGAGSSMPLRRRCAKR